MGVSRSDPDGHLRRWKEVYINAIEFDLDLSQGSPGDFAALKEGVDYRVVPIQVQKVQEAITYGASDDLFIYSPEYQDSDQPVPRGMLYAYKGDSCGAGTAPQ